MWIYSLLHLYQGLYDKIEKDLERWSKLPNSLQARISIIKMDVLPRINFYSSMVPLAPPKRYWEKLDSLTSKLVWNGKRPRLKLKTLQRDRTQGGLALPYFKMYFGLLFFAPCLHGLILMHLSPGDQLRRICHNLIDYKT